MYSVTAALNRRECSSALATGTGWGSLSLRRSSMARRERAHSGVQLRGPLRGKRKPVGPELHGALGEWAFAGGLIALLREDRGVEGGVVGPGLQDAVIEIEAGELGAHDEVVHLLSDGPA